eukprot:223663-Pyramimonas_sp.AAC.1
MGFCMLWGGGSQFPTIVNVRGISLWALKSTTQRVGSKYTLLAGRDGSFDSNSYALIPVTGP